jgi:hypothetical protein
VKARDDDGVQLDAEFEVERTEAGFDIIFHSRGGSDEKARNSKYAPALRLVLRRMAAHGYVLQDARNASTGINRSPDQRRLHLRGHSYPIELAEVPGVKELQGDLGDALAAFDRPAHKKSGGNPTKRLRLSVTPPGSQGVSMEAFETLLAGRARSVGESSTPPPDPPPVWTEPPTDDPVALAASVLALRRKLKGRPAPTAPPSGSPGGRQVVGQTVRYVRDPNVIVWVLEAAAGRCEVCDQPAPFAREDGSSYLEVHHVRPLAEGGPDTPDNAVAACPNCHRRLHYGSGRGEVRGEVIAKVNRLKDHGVAATTESPLPGER